MFERSKYILVLTFFMLFNAQNVWSQDNIYSLYEEDIAKLWMVADATTVGINTDYKPINIPDEQFRKPFLTENQIHQYLGLASLGAAVVAALTVPENGGSGRAAVENTHHRAAYWASYLGGAAVVSGFWAHSDDLFAEPGLFDTDNVHALLGILGAVGYYLAVNRASDNWLKNNSTGTDHATAGILGGVSMAAAITITW